MNEFIKLGLGLVAFGFGWEIAKKPKSEKGLTIENESDTVKSPTAKSVPIQNESESETNCNDNSDQPNGGDTV